MTEAETTGRHNREFDAGQVAEPHNAVTIADQLVGRNDWPALQFQVADSEYGDATQMLHVASKSASGETSTSVLVAEVEGEPCQVSLNSRFVLDALAVMDDDTRVVIDVNSAEAPCKLTRDGNVTSKYRAIGRVFRHTRPRRRPLCVATQGMAASTSCREEALMVSRAETVVEKRVANVAFRVCYDKDPVNLRREEPLTRIVSWARAVEGDEHDYANAAAFLESVRPGDIVRELYGHVHSGVALALEPFSDPWDSGMVGYVLVTPERMEAVGLDPANTALLDEQIRADIEIEQHYINGMVYEVHAHGLAGGVPLQEPLAAWGGLYGFDDDDFDKVAWDMRAELPVQYADAVTQAAINETMWETPGW